MLSCIDDEKIDWLGKRVFCRLDLNVPLDKAGQILDDSRILASLETIKFLLSKGARLIIASHLGRPKGKARQEFSLVPVAVRLGELLEQEIVFVHDCIGDGIKRLSIELKPGSVLFLENLRFHSGEEKNDEAFARQLSQNIDIYVNDAFGVSHRAHASVESITRFVKTKCVGFLIEKELNALSKITKKPAKPFVAIIGGSKVSDKLGILSRLLNQVNTLLVGGAMAYTFMKALGQEVGDCKYEEALLDSATKILEKAGRLGVKLVLPVDHRVTKEFSSDAKTRITNSLESGDIAIDIGPKTEELFSEHIKSAKTIFWNGPMGVFEWESGFSGTLEIAKSIAENHEFTVIGGGDSTAAVRKAGLSAEISHISTGGGASLEYIEGLELPGLKALGIAKDSIFR